MKTWETATIYRENNIRLMKCHLAVAALYIVFGVFLLAAKGEEMLPALILLGIPVSLHTLLAYGSYKKVELSRKASVVMFILLAIGTAPIGIALAIFLFIPATQWQAPTGCQELQK